MLTVQTNKMLALFSYDVEKAIEAGNAAACLTIQQQEIMRELIAINNAVEDAHTKLMNNKGAK